MVQRKEREEHREKQREKVRRIKKQCEQFLIPIKAGFFPEHVDAALFLSFFFALLLFF